MAELSPERIAQEIDRYRTWRDKPFSYELAMALTSTQKSLEEAQAKLISVESLARIYSQNAADATAKLRAELDERRKLREKVAEMQIADHLDIGQDVPSHNRTINRVFSLIDSMGKGEPKPEATLPK